MTDTIRLMFQWNIDIINCSYKTISCLRKQNFYQGMHYSKKAIDILTKNIGNLIGNQNYFNMQDILIDISYVNQMLGSLMDAQENKDYILVADLYELQLIPFLLKLQEYIVGREDYIFNETLYKKNVTCLYKRFPEIAELIRKCKNPMQIDNDYAVEYTSSGQMTLAVYENDKKYYFHSNNNASLEAAILAAEWFDVEYSEYHVYGFGLGYHIKELMELDDSITIKVFESDLNILQLSCGFQDLEDILLSDRIHIYFDPDFSKLNEAICMMNENTSLVLHYPSIRNIRDIQMREKLEDYFISYHSIKNQLHSLNSNFKNNIIQVKQSVDNLSKKFCGKDLYIIAAGPSLDLNFNELKNLKTNSIILATGTIFKKLISAGIIPDYVIISDANEQVYEQIKDIEFSKIPLLLMSTAYHKIAKEYHGEKYLIFQEGYRKAEEYAKKCGYCLYETGGSVATIAMDLGIQFNCKRIIFVGLDLAYTNNQFHSTGTAIKNKIGQEFLRCVESIDGGQVNTGKNLDMYRKWIEKRIEDVKEIEFINATEGGAKIKGMKIEKLKNVIKNTAN